jgi:hypothetical protein
MLLHEVQKYVDLLNPLINMMWFQQNIFKVPVHQHLQRFYNTDYTKIIKACASKFLYTTGICLNGSSMFLKI